jgi:hypothetical protein
MRFLNVVLTIIAVELGWMVISQTGVPVSAQPAATRVVITGIEVPRNQSLPTTLRGVDLGEAFVPVALYGEVEEPPEASRFEPINVRSSSPLKIEADRPLRIQEPVTVRIPVTSSPKPGL